MILKIALLTLAVLAILWQRSTDNRLPWTVLWVLASVFLSRVYWVTNAGTLRAEQLACLVLFVHFLVDLLRRHKWPRFELLPLLLLALLPLMVAGSLLDSPLAAASLKKTLIYFPYLGGFIALYYFLDSRTKLAAAWDFLIRFGTGMLAVSLAGYFLFFVGVDLKMSRIEDGIIWLRGSLVNPNIFGAAAGMVLISVLARFLASTKSSGRHSIFDLGALVIASASLVVSFSRGDWIVAALAAAAVFLSTRRERKNWLPALSAILLSVLLTGVITIVGSNAYNSKLTLKSSQVRKTAAKPPSRITNEFGEPLKIDLNQYHAKVFVATNTPFQQRLFNGFNSLRWRFKILFWALQDWVESPIIGRGTDSLMLRNPGIHMYRYYIPISCVAILHDWGIIALILYAAFLLLAGFRLWKRRLLPASTPGLSLAVFFVFFFQTVQSQFGTTMQLASFWVMAALFAAAAAKNGLPGIIPKPVEEKVHDRPSIT